MALWNVTDIHAYFRKAAIALIVLGSFTLTNHRKEQNQWQIKEIIDLDLEKYELHAELLLLSNPKTLNKLEFFSFIKSCWLLLVKTESFFPRDSGICFARSCQLQWCFYVGEHHLIAPFKLQQLPTG